MAEEERLAQEAAEASFTEVVEATQLGTELAQAAWRRSGERQSV